MKNSQYMKNINPIFKKKTQIEQLIITNVKHVIINQSTTRIDFTQFSPILQNPQFPQVHMNPNFEIFQEA